MSYQNAAFFALLQSQKIPIPKAEYRFDKKRLWRFDYAWPEQMFAMEVEGGVWIKGRHIRPKGFLKDMEKYNTAAIQGWRVIRTTPRELLTMETIKLLKNNL